MFFFFFKQKTAYEMRISDWSSDVCSSDLQATDEAELLADDGEHEVGVGFGQEAALGPAGAQPGARHTAGGDADEGLDGLVAGVAGLIQIGRASCREGVLQYGSLSVVAVTVKTNKKHSTEERKEIRK